MRNLAGKILLISCILIGQSRADESGLCDEAARRAASISDVPLALLLAITRVETGRGDPAQPWPWTINIDGRGYWFHSKAETIAFADARIAGGQESFDLGCFQMNLRWHGDRFLSISEMLDPQRNAEEAARFLSALHAETGSWTKAAATYHSRTADLGVAYVRKVAALVPPAAAPPTAEPVVRANDFPLLKVGASGARGSLVPRTEGRGTMFGAD